MEGHHQEKTCQEMRKLKARNKFNLPKGITGIVLFSLALSLILSRSYSLNIEQEEIINFVPACWRNVTITEQTSNVIGYENTTVFKEEVNTTLCEPPPDNLEEIICKEVFIPAHNETRQVPVYENITSIERERWDCDEDYDLGINDYVFNPWTNDLDVNFTCMAVTQNAVGKDLPAKVKVPTKAIDNMVNSRAVTAVPQDLSQKIRISNVESEQDVKQNPVELHCGENSAVYTSTVSSVYSCDNGIVKFRYDGGGANKGNTFRFYGWDNSSSDWAWLSFFNLGAAWEDSGNVNCFREETGQSWLKQSNDVCSLFVSCENSGKHVNLTLSILRGSPSIKIKAHEFAPTAGIDTILAEFLAGDVDQGGAKFMDLVYFPNTTLVQSRDSNNVVATTTDNLNKNFFVMANTTDDLGFIVSFDQDSTYTLDYSYRLGTSYQIRSVWAVDNDIPSGGGWDNDTTNKSWWWSPFVNLPINMNSRDNAVDEVGYWSLDSNTLDKGSGDNDGTAKNGPTYVYGKYGTALKFNDDTNTEAVELPLNILSNGDCTACLWANLANKTMPSMENLLSIEYVFRLAYDPTLDRFFGRSYDGASDDVTHTTASLDTWYHVCITNDDTDLKLWIDGSEVNTTSANNPIFDTYERLSYIGNRADTNTEGVNGTVDEVRVWNSALNSAEIMEVYMGTREVFDCINPAVGCSYWDYSPFHAENISQTMIYEISSQTFKNNTNLDIWQQFSWDTNTDEWSTSGLYLAPYPENSTDHLHTPNINITGRYGKVPAELGITARAHERYQGKGFLLVPNILYNGILGGANITSYNVTLKNATHIYSLVFNTTFYFWEWWDPNAILGVANITVDGFNNLGFPVHNIIYKDVSLNGATQSVFHPKMSYHYVNDTETYPSKSMETANETYTSTWWINGTWVDVDTFNASLWWNESIVGYDSKTNTSITNYTFTKYHITPVLSSDNIAIRSFWNKTYDLVNGSDGIKTGQNETSFSMNLLQAFFGNCTHNDSIVALIITFRDALNETTINGTLSAGFNITINNTFTRNITEITWSNNDTYSLCIGPSWQTFYIGGDINYEGEPTAGYEKHFYYLRNQSYSNATEQIYFYCLTSYDGDTNEIIVQDNLQVKKGDVLVRLYKYFEKYLQYKGPMDSRLTTPEGKVFPYVKRTDEVYQIILINTTTGEAIDTKSNIIFDGSTYTFTLAAEKSIFETVNDYSATCTFNTGTNVSSLTYSSQKSATWHLQVRKLDESNATISLYCDNSATGTSGSLGCNMNNTDGVFVHVGWVDTGTFNHTYCTFSHEHKTWFDFGFEGVFVIFVLIVALALAGFNATASMLFSVVALAVGIMLQIIHISSESVVILAILAGVIIFLSRRK